MPSEVTRPLIQAIKTGTILNNATHDIEHLIGKPPQTRDENPEQYDGLMTIASFLRQHQFLFTTDVNESSNSGVLTRTYIPTIDAFTKTQLERQCAGLRTNTTSASTAALKTIVDCHTDALNYAMESVAVQDETWLTSMEQNLCTVHSKLCPNIPQSGRFRTNKVRASNTAFAAPNDIKTEMSNLSSAIKRFQSEWLSSTMGIINDSQWCESVYKKIAIASIIMFGVNDIHPFQDGNGRTSRIFLNVALRRLLGLPFTVVVCATQQQRREYVNGLKDCRTRLGALSRQASRISIPVFQSLFTVVFDRVLHAVRQVKSLIDAKTQAAATEEEERIARRVRERAANDQCCICLDEGPEVSTLCCGQVVHMGCLAEWLSNNGSCITCRKPMRRLAQRQNQPNLPAVAAVDPLDVAAIQQALAEDATDDTTTMDDETNNDNEAEDSSESNHPTEDTTEIDDVQEEAENHDTTEDTTEIDDVEEEVENNDTTEDMHNDTTEDTDNDDSNDATEDTTIDLAESDDDVAASPPHYDTTNDTTSEEDTCTTSHQTTHTPSVYCGHCGRNRFAVDCSNRMCGCCCQFYGEDSCYRHNC
jgi:fido (protein-threonine AMPylation protein)